MKIPDIIHFVWIKDFNQAPSYAATNILSFKDLNPEFKIMLWDESKVLRLMTKREKWHYHCCDMLIKKADFARMIVLREYGGYYFDCDIEPSKPLRELKTGRAFSSDDKDLSKGSYKNFDFGSCDLILQKEWNPERITVANGIIFAAPKNEVIEKFIEARMAKFAVPVLDYMGPHALTRFIKNFHKSNKILILKPSLFLWEASLGEQPDWSYALHLAENTWGDKSRKDWWKV